MPVLSPVSTIRHDYIKKNPEFLASNTLHSPRLTTSMYVAIFTRVIALQPHNEVHCGTTFDNAISANK